MSAPTNAWRHVHASAQGTSHASTGAPCQDAASARLVSSVDGDVLVLACSDGAGSASHSHLGARWACDTVLGEVSDFLAAGGSVATVTRAHAEDWYLQAHRCLAERAAEEGLAPRQLACTLLVAVVAPTASAFMQIGDGAIVIAPSPDAGVPSASAEYVPVFWPQSGEYANMTYFLTEPEALTHLVLDTERGRVDEVALFSDGIQSLALRFEERAVHAPFFRPMFARLRHEPAGLSSPLAGQLEQFLNSANVNARTDDDKTLVLATRRPAPADSSIPAANGPAHPPSEVAGGAPSATPNDDANATAGAR